MGRDRSHPIDPRTAEGLLRDGADGGGRYWPEGSIMS